MFTHAFNTYTLLIDSIGNAVLTKLFWALANAKEMFANKLVTPLFQLN